MYEHNHIGWWWLNKILNYNSFSVNNKQILLLVTYLFFVINYTYFPMLNGVHKLNTE